jgi:hypothetical protein
LLSALLGACSQPAKEPVPEVQAPPPEPAKPPPVPVLHTEWSFGNKGDECLAAATAGATALRISVRRDSAIRLTISLAKQYGYEASVPLRFVGPAGKWQVTARAYGTSLLGVTLGSDNTALSHVLVLLSGGTFNVGLPPHAVVSLVIKPSDTNGQNWFDCAREKLM